MTYKRGDKWFGFYRDAAGSQHTKQFTRKRDADLWEQEQKAAIRNDAWVDPGRSKVTVGEWADPLDGRPGPPEAQDAVVLPVVAGHSCAAEVEHRSFDQSQTLRRRGL